MVTHHTHSTDPQLPIDEQRQLMCVCVCLSSQGCYSAMVAYLETYIYTTGALAIVVLTIEVRTAVYNYNYD